MSFDPTQFADEMLAVRVAAFECKDDRADRSLALGHALESLKQAVGHGNFLPALHTVGISRKSAAKLMRLSRIFNGGKARELAAQIRKISHLDELACQLNVEEMWELVQKGEVHSLSVQVIAALSIKELRQRLRAAIHERERAIHERWHAEHERQLAAFAKRNPDGYAKLVAAREERRRVQAQQDDEEAESMLLQAWRQCDSRDRGRLLDIALLLASSGDPVYKSS